MPSPAREAAFYILLRVEQRQSYASELLHSDHLAELSPQDRALCTELVMGTLRWRSRLDFGIGAVSSQPLEKLDAEVLTALRLSAYQVGFLRVPARAAVNESVELVKLARKRSAAPFVNAVLRKLAAKPDLMAPVLAPGPKTVLDLAQLYAHPLWLVERWASKYGMTVAERTCAFDQATPVTALRVRDAAAEEELWEDGIELAPGALLKSVRRVVKGDVTHTRAVVEGRVAVLDEASQLVALLVGRGERLLDCCAAPGGKTGILAERNPGSVVIAADLHPHRARLMRQRVRESNVHVVVADAVSLPLSGKFDRVLADVPCSGTGTLARNPEIKWRLQAEDLADLHRRQAAILSSALERVSPGGRLVYSCCSLEREEGEDVVEESLRGTQGLRVVECREELKKLRDDISLSDINSLLEGPYLRTIPGVQPCDGFFAAVVQRE
jgi:16S rRNA (cytosine967-C5)-methyltransferase